VRKGDVVCYKGDRSALATIAIVYPGQEKSGQAATRAKIIWLTGPSIGKTRIFDVRDLIKVKQAG